MVSDAGGGATTVPVAPAGAPPVIAAGGVVWAGFPAVAMRTQVSTANERRTFLSTCLNAATADTTWVVLTALLLFLMTPGFAMCRPKPCARERIVPLEECRNMLANNVVVR